LSLRFLGRLVPRSDALRFALFLVFLWIVVSAMISRPAQVYWADRLTTNRFHHHLLQPLVVGAWVAVVALGVSVLAPFVWRNQAWRVRREIRRSTRIRDSSATPRD